MKLLTRPEELVLLSVLKLSDNAYCVPILEQIERITRKKWSLGAIYIPLYRLEEKGFLESELGDPSGRRGGKRKRFYRVTSSGKEALRSIRRIEEEMWADIKETILEYKP